MKLLRRFTKTGRSLRPSLSAMALLSATLTACATQVPMKTVTQVDINRFMGTWYVVANIPTWVEKGAHNAVEQYALNPDGSIATTFTFRKNSFDGPEKRYHPKGFIRDEATNALWGMQFIWPFKGDFRIVYLSDDYSQTVIARQARDYVWVMKRSPDFSTEEMIEMKQFVRKLGYDDVKLQRVPQHWPVTKEQAS